MISPSKTLLDEMVMDFNEFGEGMEYSVLGQHHGTLIVNIQLNAMRLWEYRGWLVIFGKRGKGWNLKFEEEFVKPDRFLGPVAHHIIFQFHGRTRDSELCLTLPADGSPNHIEDICFHKSSCFGITLV
jgi:hypothetical protein